MVAYVQTIPIDNGLACMPKTGDLTLRTHDIVFPRRTYLNRPNLSLEVRDIDGAVPKQNNNNQYKRRTNPLDPEYKLASYKPTAPHQYRFTRNSIDVSDIPGSQVKRPYHLTCTPRDNINYADVPRSTQGWRSRDAKRSTVLDGLDVRDINRDITGMHRFHTKRRTNPLSPRYVVAQCSDLMKIAPGERRTVTIGRVRNARPATNYRFGNKETDFSLRTDDVAGATITRDPYYRTRRIRNPNDIGDIPGTGAGSFKPFRSLRMTNPLNPRYKLLDTPEVTPRQHLSRTMPMPVVATRLDNSGPVARLELAGVNQNSSQPQPIPAHAAPPRSNGSRSRAATNRSYRSGSQRSRRSGSLSRAGSAYLRASMATRRARDQLNDDIQSVRSLC